MLVGTACVVWMLCSRALLDKQAGCTRRAPPHEKMGGNRVCEWVLFVDSGGLGLALGRGKSTSPLCDVETLHPRRADGCCSVCNMSVVRSVEHLYHLRPSSPCPC